jgi:hypothetical protein
VVHLDDVPVIPTAEAVTRVRIARADRGGVDIDKRATGPSGAGASRWSCPRRLSRTGSQALAKHRDGGRLALVQDWNPSFENIQAR